MYISSGQGPAPLTGGTLVREFFDEEHVPLLYIDMDTYLPKLKLARGRPQQGIVRRALHHRTNDRPAAEGRLRRGGVEGRRSGS